MIDVGIFGGTGYMGGEALRVLLEHPRFNVKWITSRNDLRVDAVHRNLLGVEVPVLRQEDVTECDAYLLALPSGQAMNLAASLLANDAVVVDLGADFRLRNRDDWERVYGMTHESWELASTAVYGIPELHRDEIKESKLIANPGCFSSAVILGIIPLAKAGIFQRVDVHVTGISGTAGAGAELSLAAHHPEIGNNVVFYNVVDHRHTYEMEQELARAGIENVAVHFTPTYVPITRGIAVVCHLPLPSGMSLSAIRDVVAEYYNDEPFVRLMPDDRDAAASWQWRPYPSVNSVSGTNYCNIGVDVDERRERLVVFSVLDSIGKGGAHAGVQNLNILFDLPETTGLSRYGLHPY